MSIPRVRSETKPQSEADAFGEINAILHAFTRLAGRCENDLAEAAAEHDLGSQQAAVLFTLLRGGPTRMSSLSHSLECDAGNLSGMIDRLEETGYVARSVSATDRRVRMLSLTAAGRRIAMKIERRLEGSRLLAALVALDPAERRSLSNSLAAVMDASAADART